MKFGESIFINDNFSPNNQGILIDCGSLYSKINSTYDIIYNNIKDLNPDVLITHFHKDHISGLLYFAINKKSIFNNLYIPDIFNLRNSSKIVTLILIDYLLQSVKISSLKNASTLYDLVLGLCSTSKKIKFLKRNDEFRNYKVLAPFEEDIINAAESLYNDLKPFSSDWDKISSNFIKIISSKVDGEQLSQSRIYSRELSITDSMFKDLERLSQNDSQAKKSLNSFGHKINIVFHSKNNSVNENILFTGDAECNQLDKLKSLGDFYNQYKIYKIPHHGTKKHLYKDIDSDIAIISNAKHKNLNWKICSDYHLKNYCFYCTNCNCCEQWDSFKVPNYCQTTGNYLVFANKSQYLDIII